MSGRLLATARPGWRQLATAVLGTPGRRRLLLAARRRGAHLHSPHARGKVERAESLRDVVPGRAAVHLGGRGDVAPRLSKMLFFRNAN